MRQQLLPFRYEAAPEPTASRALDIHIGGRIRARRCRLGWSCERLGNALDIGALQVWRSEAGLDHVAAARFFDLSQALGVPISFFFDDPPDLSTRPPAASPGGFATERVGFRQVHPAAANDAGPAAPGS